MGDRAELERLRSLDAGTGSRAELERLRALENSPPQENSPAYDFSRALGTRLATGAAGVGQTLINAVGPQGLKDYVNQGMSDFESDYQREVPNSPAALTGSTIGTVAPWLVGGLAKAPAAIANLPRLAKSVMTGIGAGGVAPVVNGGDFGEQKLTQVLLGGALGLGIPAGVELTKWAGGAAADIGKTIGAAFGSNWATNKLAVDAAIRLAGEARDKIIGSLKSADGQGVAGYNPTVAEAIGGGQKAGQGQFGGATIAAQKALTGATGAEDVLLSARKAQDEAMLGPIQRMAGGADTQAQNAAQASAKSARTASAGVQYKALAPQQVAGDKQLETILQSPAGQQALGIAEKISANASAAQKASGETPIDFAIRNKAGKVVGFTAQGLQHIKEALDSMATDKSLQQSLGISAQSKNAIGDVRKALVGWMNKNVQGWEAARNAYAAQSQPVNKLQVAQTIAEKMQSEGGKLTPNTVLNALGRGEESLLKTSLGAPRQTNLQQLFGADYPHLEGTAANLARRQETERIGNAVRGNAPTGNEVPRLPNLLSRTSMLVNALLGKAGSRADEMVQRRLAEQMRDPQGYAALLETVKGGQPVLMPQIERAALISALRQQQQGN